MRDSTLQNKNHDLTFFVVAVAIFSAFDLLFGWIDSGSERFAESVSLLNFISQAFSSGSFPFWNPFVKDGQSVFASAFTTLNPFSIDNLISVLLSPFLPNGVRLHLLDLKMAVCGAVYSWGVYSYISDQGHSKRASLFAALVAYLSLTAVTVTTPDLLSAIVFVPWIFFVGHRLSSQPKKWIWPFLGLIYITLFAQFGRYSLSVLCLVVIYVASLARQSPLLFPKTLRFRIVAGLAFLAGWALPLWILYRGYLEGVSSTRALFNLGYPMTKLGHLVFPLTRAADFTYLTSHPNVFQYFGILGLIFLMIGLYYDYRNRKQSLVVPTLYFAVSTLAGFSQPLLIMLPVLCLPIARGFQICLDDSKWIDRRSKVLSRIYKMGPAAVLLAALVVAGLMIKDSTWGTRYQGLLNSAVFITLSILFFVWIRVAEIWSVRYRILFLIISLDLLSFNYVAKHAKSGQPLNRTEYSYSDLVFNTGQSSPRYFLSQTAEMAALDLPKSESLLEVPTLRTLLVPNKKLKDLAEFQYRIPADRAPVYYSYKNLEALFETKASWLDSTPLKPSSNGDLESNSFGVGNGRLPRLLQVWIPQEDVLKRRKDILSLAIRYPDLGFKLIELSPDTVKLEVISPDRHYLVVKSNLNEFWQATSSEGSKGFESKSAGTWFASIADFGPKVFVRYRTAGLTTCWALTVAGFLVLLGLALQEGRRQ
ncbi:MAG: hypothetical protein AB7F86_10560 [Bdellovibrionales bacterium]